MQVAVTFRHMDSTEALKEYANEKVSKAAKYLSRATQAHVILCVEKLQHRAEVLIDAGGIHVRGESHSDNMYKSIDEAVDKIVKQITRYKDKIHNHKPRSAPEIPVSHQVFSLPNAAEQNHHTVVEQKQIMAKPMSVDDAVMQMDLIGNDFFIFQNIDSKLVNVLYRREGGEFGLIEASTR